MKSRQRLHRNAFWLFLGVVMPALALPYLNAQSASEGSTRPPPPPAPAADSPRADFQRADRNRDGVIDKSEAGAVPGLSAYFEKADRNRDGKLDREEFSRGLVLVGQK